MKNKNMIRPFSFIASLLMAFLISGVLLLSVQAQELTQGYISDQTLARGTIVALNQEDQSRVEPINQSQLDRLFGVVVRSNDSPLTLSDEDRGVFVATKGKFEVLVSDVNGEVKSGELITVSPFSGVGMAADDRQKLIIATALDDFDVNNTDQVLSQADVADDQGNTHKASIGRILAEVEVKPNPRHRSNQAVPAFLSELSSSIAQKPVSATRIYAGMVVLFISSAVAASLMYSVVRSAVISIGRNPLSKKSVLRGIVQVIFVSIIIFVAGLFAVYLILKL